MYKRNILLVLLGLLLMFGLYACTDDDKVNTITGDDDTTNTGGGISHPAGQLFVLNQGDNSIYVYDSKTLKRIDSIDSRVDKPHYIEFSPDRNSFYVTTLEISGHMAKFNAVNNTFIDSVSTGPNVQPTAVAITSNSDFGYVCNFFGTAGNLIYKYDLATLQQVSTIPAGQITHDIKITSDGSIVIATNRYNDYATLLYTDGDTIVPVGMDPDTLHFTNVSHKYGPFGVIIDSNDSLAYIACADSREVRVLDLAAQKIVDSIKIPVDTSGFIFGPTLLAISPDNSHVFVTTRQGNSCVVLQTSPLKVVTEIDFATTRSFGIDISSDGSRVYVAAIGDPSEHGRVYIIDGNSFKKLDSLDVGRESFGLRWQPPRP